MAEKYVVEGYEFDTLEEANQAKVEMDAVKYMSQKTAGAAPEVALKIYRKIVDNNLFHTEIGMDYLRALEEYLIEFGMFDVGSTVDAKRAAQEAYEKKAMEAPVKEPPLDVEPSILVGPDDTNLVNSTPEDEGSLEEKKDVRTKKGRKEKSAKKKSAKKKEKAVSTSGEESISDQSKWKQIGTLSLFFNILLVLVIGCMIAINATSSNINILNYETKLQDKYSGWADELAGKETQLREREKSLRTRERNVALKEKELAELETALTGSTEIETVEVPPEVEETTAAP